MAGMGFDIDEYREDALRRQERAEDMGLKREANAIAASQAKTAHRALLVSVGAAIVSLIALAVAIIK